MSRRPFAAQVLVLLLGELKLQLRQPYALLLMLIFPLVAGPGGLLGVNGMLAASESDRDAPADGEKELLAIAAPVELEGWLTEADRLRVVDGRLPAEGPPDEVLAEVELTRGEATIRFRADLARSRSARDRLKKVLRRERDRRTLARLADAGVPLSPDELVVIEMDDLSTERERSGTPLGVTLACLLLFTLSMAGLYTAVDVITGEKERGTIETLLTTGADRRAVVLAKLAIVTCATAISGWVLLAGLAVAQALGWLVLPSLLGAEADLIGNLPLLALASLLLAVQLAGVLLVLASYVHDYKAASMLSAPVLFTLMVPGAAGMLPFELGPFVALLPIANVAFAIRDLLAGELTGPMLALVMVASSAHAAISMGAAWWLYGRESVLLGLDDGAARRRLGFHGRDAALLYALVMLLFWFFGQTAQMIDLEWGMALTQIVIIGGAAIGGVAWLGLPLADTLSLRRPRAPDLLLALLAGLLAPLVGSLVFVLQGPWIPPSDEVLEQMSALTLADRPLWEPLLLFAVLPALFEELLYRGTLLGLLRRSLPVVPRVIAVSIAFGAMHIVLMRLLPTTALGLLMTIAVVRSGSLWPAVVIHFLNNATVIVIGRYVTQVEMPSPPVLAAGATAAFGAVLLMGRFSPRPPSS